MRITCTVLLMIGLLGGVCLSADVPDPAATAKLFVRDLADGKWAAAREKFAPQVKAAMSEDQLRQAWSQLVGAVGPLAEIAGAREAAEAGFRCVYVSGRFEKGAMDVKVVFDAQGQVAGLWFTAPPAEPWTPPAYADPAKFEERPVSVVTGKFTLPGKLCLPKQEGPCPAVVLVHGSGPEDEDESVGGCRPFKDLAWGLASRGVAVLRYTKRTKQYGAASAPDPMAITAKEEVVDDAVSALALLGRTKEVDPKRIYLLGHSLGGMLAPRIAATADPKPAGLILMAAGARPLEKIIVEQLTFLAGRNGKIDAESQRQIDAARALVEKMAQPDLNPKEIVDVAGSKIRAGYLLDLRGSDAPPAAAKLGLPVLVLRGHRDYQSTEEDMKAWQEGLKGLPKAEFHTYPALNHLFVEGKGPPGPEEYAAPGHVAPEVIDDLVRWLTAGSTSK